MFIKVYGKAFVSVFYENLLVMHNHLVDVTFSFSPACCLKKCLHYF